MPTFVFCWRIEELDHPAADSLTLQCEWQQYRPNEPCEHVVWVAPSSIEIAVSERALLVCRQHLEVAAADGPWALVAHPVQSPAHQAAIRAAGGVILDDPDDPDEDGP